MRGDPDSDSWHSEITATAASAAEARSQVTEAGFHRKRHGLTVLRPEKINGRSL